MIDLIKSEQFHIITLPKVGFSLIICHLTDLIFSINLLNQPLNQTTQSTFGTNLHKIGNATEF